MNALFVVAGTMLSLAAFSICAEWATARLNIVPQNALSSRYINITGVAVALTAGLNVQSAFGALTIAILIAALCVCAVSDLRYGLVFNSVTYPCSALLALIAYLHGEPGRALLGGLVCAAAIFLLYAMSAGRGIGLGDLKLAGCIGLGLGVEYGLIALGFAFVLGGAHGACLLLSRRAQRGHALKFAPYLALGSGLALTARWIAA